jgi:hypothetical protein
MADEIYCSGESCQEKAVTSHAIIGPSLTRYADRFHHVHTALQRGPAHPVSQYRQIILHAGFSKTGTTSIQDNCEKYRAVLQQHGIIYPQFRVGDHTFNTHSIPFTVAITGRPGKHGLMLRERFPANADEVMRGCRAQLEELLEVPQGDTLLLSTELVEGFDERDMATLRSYLLPRAQRLRVVAYIRSPQSSLESLFQERIKMGGLPDPRQFAGRVRQKYENLRRHLPDVLEVCNFHAAVRHEHGLVGAFLSLAGLPAAAIAGLTFVSSNERLSMEAFNLMWAINQRYPPRDQDIHQVPRRPRDLDVLGQLPGPPFHIAGFMSSELHDVCLQESAWLEAQTGFRFPAESDARCEPLWQDRTLALLEETLRALPGAPIVQCAAQYLREEARHCAPQRPGTARQLEAIAARLA